MAVQRNNLEQQTKPPGLACWLRTARSATSICVTILLTALTGCQNGPQTSSAPMYGQSTIAPPGTANTAMAKPGSYAASAPPMMNPGEVNGWGAPPVNGTSPPPSNWNSPSIFGSSTPPPANTTAWNTSPPPNAYGASGSIFDQAPHTQQQGVFDSFASASPSHPSNSFNPNSMARGYESPNSSFTSATPAHSANRAGPIDTGSGGSWWDRMTGTKSTVPPAGNPGWNQPGPMGAPNPAVAWNDPRNPNYARQPIPNPNAMPNNGWNITSAPNPNITNPLNTAPNYTNYGSPAPAYPPNNISRTLPASTNPLRPTNTLPASWPNGTPAPVTTSVPASGPVAVRNLEDLPPAR